MLQYNIVFAMIKCCFCNFISLWHYMCGHTLNSKSIYVGNARVYTILVFKIKASLIVLTYFLLVSFLQFLIVT